MIDSYVFGKMKISGDTYTSDLIIFPTRIFSPWWRKFGHMLQLGDLEEVFAADPEILIIGTGFLGAMKVAQEVKELAIQQGIQLHIQKSTKAVKLFNELSPNHNTIAAFHLTC